MPRAFPATPIDLPSSAFKNLPTPAKVARLLRAFPYLQSTVDAMLDQAWDEHHKIRRRRQATARLSPRVSDAD